MRAREFIIERWRSRGIGDLTFMYQEQGPGEEFDPEKHHLEAQQRERGVSDSEREAILNQIASVYVPVRRYGRNEKFWLYDPVLDKAVGLTVMDHARKMYRVATVVATRPWKQDTTITVPGVKK